MRKLYVLLVVVVLVSCKKDTADPPGLPEGAIELLDFQSQTTYLETLTLFLNASETYTSIGSQLNGEDIDLVPSVTITESGYHELAVQLTTVTESSDFFFQFVIVDPERGEAEWGIKKFVPEEIEEKSFSLSGLEFIFPKKYPRDLNMPLMFRATSEDKKPTLYGTLLIDGKETTVKRGWGSVLLPLDRTASGATVLYQGQERLLAIENVEAGYIVLGGEIESDLTLEEGGYYHLGSDLRIADGVMWTIPNGCVLKIDEGVNIYNGGQVVISGSAAQPVIFTCSDPDSQWGGFVTQGAGKSIDVEHAIFMQSGFHDSAEYQYGHARRQALFYLDNAELEISDSYLIDNIGQTFYQINDATLSMDNCLIQRAKMAGEAINSELNISNSTLMDFPEYSSRYLDSDNDGIYLIQSDASITNTSLMWTKDDGIDSGGDSGGIVEIRDCYFEGIAHEAIALSSAGDVTKRHTISDCTFRNNGQGIELGYSSPNHRVSVIRCHMEENLIGVRYGDNYNRVVAGYMELEDCTFGENIDKDIWNFVRSEWGAIEENLVY